MKVLLRAVFVIAILVIAVPAASAADSVLVLDQADVNFGDTVT